MDTRLDVITEEPAGPGEGCTLSLQPFTRHEQNTAAGHIQKENDANPQSKMLYRPRCSVRQCSVLFCSFLGRFFTFGIVFAIPAYTQHFESTFNISRTQSSLICSVGTGTVLLCSPVASWLLTKVSHRTAMLVGSVIMSAGLFLTGSTDGFYQILLCFGLVTGLGGSIVNVVSVSILSHFFTPETLSFAMGFGSSGCGFGAIAFAWVYKIGYDLCGWSNTIKLVAFSNLIVLSLSAMVFKISDSWDNDSGMSTEYDERKETEHQKLTAGKRNKLSYWSITVELLQSKIFLILIASDFLSWFAQLVPFVHIPQLRDCHIVNSTDPTYQLSPTQNMTIPECDSDERKLFVSLTQTYYGLFSSVGKIFFGAICTQTIRWWKHSPLVTFIWAQCIFGISLGVLPLIKDHYNLLLSLTVVAANMSGSYALVMVFTSLLLGAGDYFTVGYSYMLTFEAIGVYIGPPVIGYLYDINDQSYVMAFAITGLVLVASGVMLVLLVRDERKKLTQVQL